MADFNHLLTSVDFSGTLTTKTVDLTVRLSFVNRDRVSHEMVYFFRSTPQLDVYDFKIYRPNDHREASLLPRLEAGRRYAQALEEGRPAAKLTSYPYHVWELCHSRLEPGCEIIVEIKLFGAMMHHSGRSVLQLPLTIVPFNMPSEVTPEHFRMVAPEFCREVGYDCSMRFEVPNADDLQIESTTHALRVARQGNKAVVELTERCAPDRDFILRLQKRDGMPDYCYAIHNTPDQLRAQLYFRPAIELESLVAENRRQEIVFMLDQSGSMTERGRQLAFQSLNKMLASLTEQDSFNVLSIARETRLLFPHSVPVTPDNISALLQQIPVGDHTFLRGNDLIGALETVYRIPPLPAARRSIVILTDGGYWFGGRLEPLLKSHPEVRIFPVAVGEAPFTSSLFKLAFITGGVIEVVVRPADVEDAMMRHLTRIIQPPARLKITVERGEALIPPMLPPVYDGDDWDILLLFNHWEKDTVVHIEYEVGSRRYCRDVPLVIFEDEMLSEADLRVRKLYPQQHRVHLTNSRVRNLTRPFLTGSLFCERDRPVASPDFDYPTTVVVPLQLLPGSVTDHLNIYELFEKQAPPAGTDG